MNQVVRTLETIEAEIDNEWRAGEKEFEEAQRLQESYKQRAVRIGLLLQEAKPLIPNGQWMAWYIAKGYAPQRVSEYMRIAKKHGKLITDVGNQQIPKESSRRELERSIKQEVTIIPQSKPTPSNVSRELPSAKEVFDELVSKISKFCHDGTEVRKLTELLKHLDQMTDHHLDVAAQTLDVAANALTVISSTIKEAINVR